MNFTIGDVVQLKSGGPSMTYTRDPGLEGVECAWFHNGEYRTARFPPSALKRVEPQKPGKKLGRRCACSDEHPLAGHTPDGRCLHRGPNGEPCVGKCRIIEAERSA